MTRLDGKDASQRSGLTGPIAVLVLAILASCGTESAPPPQTQTSAGNTAAAARATTTADGSPVVVGGVSAIDSVLMGQRGRWVLVNVWATWCRPCVAETPDLVALHQSLQGKQFTLLGISADFMTSPTPDEALKKVRAFNAQHRVPYANVIFSGSTDDLTTRFSLSGAIPASILYDPQGKEIERWVGRLVEEDFARIKTKVS